MAIFIGRRPDNGFTRVPNEWARDPKLSYKAKGLLTYLLSHEDGYRLTLEQMIAESTGGKAAVYSAIKELRERGYLECVQRRGDGGKAGEMDYYVADSPAQTASQLSASRKPESGDDLGKHDEGAGETASRLSASRLSAYRKSDTKKTRVKKTKDLEDEEKTTSPNPSTPGTDLEVVDAEIVEEAEDATSPTDQLQNLIDEARKIRPNWSATDLRAQIAAALRSLDENFEAVTTLVLNTAADPDTAKPSRITASGNPHLRNVNTALMVQRADAMPDTGPVKPLHPNAHAFVPKGDGSKACGWNNCELPEPNERHKVGNQGGGYVGRTPTGRTDSRRNGYEPWRETADQSDYDVPFADAAARRRQQQ
ncbi:hypothetical protein AB0F72_08465 [Actinoplanes sp. NPDC023936]|uniref:hypothetical protein n=1 Tax=Actinoplanes sp. NPDC023936 TaxID=3154910 RepID=UPI0033EA624F